MGAGVSAARAFLKPVRGRSESGLVRTDARAACQIMLDGQARRRGAISARSATACGAGGPGPPRGDPHVPARPTPRGCCRVSGIGPAGLLERSRHRRCSTNCAASARISATITPCAWSLRAKARRADHAERIVARPSAWRLAGRALGGTGQPSILATAPSQVHVFWKSFEGLDQPDLQCVFTTWLLQARCNLRPGRLSRHDRRRLAASPGKQRAAYVPAPPTCSSTRCCSPTTWPMPWTAE